MADRTLYVLAGPTAVGKTALALEWAEANDAEILSCDTLLVYRGMDLGTAKPTPAERAQVAHHGINVVDAAQPFNVRAYLKLASEAVRAIHARGRRVLVVGGSGFYLKSFFAPVTDALEIPESICTEVAKLMEHEGLAGAVARLRAVSPEGLGRVDVCNPRRVVKALERCLASGLSVPALEALHASRGTPFDPYTKRLVLLERADAELKDRIRQRTQAMLEAGLVAEVRSLLGQGLLQNASAARAVGYRETIAWLESKADDLGDLLRAIETSTWQLVRKQRTWFRHQVPIERTVLLPPGGNADVSTLFG
ncbi:MAG: tRNA (adenosine(37)-N6)-dimethylallyltransferase MiaA [Opitutales bacterium]